MTKCDPSCRVLPVFGSVNVSTVTTTGGSQRRIQVPSQPWNLVAKGLLAEIFAVDNELDGHRTFDQSVQHDRDT
jgi:hypothetical protein